MRVAIYVRVSTLRQAQAQPFEQQLERLKAHIQANGWILSEQAIYIDDGYSGSSLKRPGLDLLRDRVAAAEFDLVLITSPDRLARNYVHQVLLLEELQRFGCKVEFPDRPMTQDPHDQLLLQICGAVAEYERTLITERMRRGRLLKLRSGLLLPWTHTPYGYRVNPERPRDPAGVRLDPAEAAIVAELFATYLEESTSLFDLARYLFSKEICSPRGKKRWGVASLRGILTNPAYTGQVYAGRMRYRPARFRPARPVSMSVFVICVQTISATHRRLAASAWKRRCTRSGAGRWRRSRRVVVGDLRRLTPTRPLNRIRRATRLRATAWPTALSS